MEENFDERIVKTTVLSEDEEEFSLTVRPRTLDEYIGQEKLKEKLSIALQAAKMRKEPLEHVLLHGPPGLGKTTLAHIIAKEMGSQIIVTSGPALERQGDLMGILTNLERGDVLLIDEIHRLPRVVEEFLYPSIEDFRVDFTVDKGAFAKILNVPLKPFTLVGATTRAGALSAPLRERFGLIFHIDFYPENELEEIVKRTARILELEYEDDAMRLIASRGRGTPRVVNRLLRRVRDYAQVKSDGKITKDIVEASLNMEAIDYKGLDELDRKYLKVLIELYQGGPTGIDAIAASLNESTDTLEDMVEPYLLKIGFLTRGRSGRTATPEAWKHISKTPPAHIKQQGLFD